MDPIKKITHARVLELVIYDSESGIFTRKIATGRHGRYRAGDKVGNINTAGYMVSSIDGEQVYLHRLAVFYMTGEWPENDVDHKDCNRGNNAWENLRCATRMINCQNRLKSRTDRRHGTMMGVKKKRNSWMARIRSEGVDYYLGSFKTEQLAHNAYVDAKRSLHIGCTL